MTSPSKRRFANRLGYGLGRGARFFYYDAKPSIRLIKRTSVVLIFAAVVMTNWGEIQSALSTVVFLVLLGFLLVKAGPAMPSDGERTEPMTNHPDIPRQGRDGYGYYDSYGNFRGISHPSDD